MKYNGIRTCKRTDCLYYSPKGDYNGCDHMYLTGNLRGCPKGTDCIRYKYATEQQRLQYRTEIFEKQEEARVKKYRTEWEYDGETIP